MSGIGELQTVSAIFDLLKVAYQAGKFLKEVKDADKIALELSDRITRLSKVLDGVSATLQARDDRGAADVDEHGAQDAAQPLGSHGLDAQVTARIHESIILCTEILENLGKRLGGFHIPKQTESRKTIVDRVKIAVRHKSIARISHDLEARIHILSTDLSVLQLLEQRRIHQAIGDNHDELLSLLANLGVQVNDGTRLLKQLLHDNVITRRRRTSDVASSEVVDDFDRETIASLVECIRTAEDIHEKYTSEYRPDDRSERYRDAQENTSLASPPAESPPEAAWSRSPSRDGMPVPAIVYPEDEDQFDDDPDAADEDDVYPLEVMNMHIGGYIERTNKELELEHFNQAESHLRNAIRYSELREVHHLVPFVGKAKMQEELALLFQKQGKWAEAVALVHQLLRDSAAATSDGSSTLETGLATARLNQLLASIYYDRHKMNPGAALSLTEQDIAKAELHARRAFNKRWKLSAEPDQVHDDQEREACIQLLVKVLETRDKTVESNELRKLLSDGSSTGTDSIRRISTAASRHQLEYDLVDKNDALAAAISARDFDQIENLLAARDIDLEKFDKDGRTPLMLAISVADELTVYKLLDPEVGALLETRDKRNRTALHHAAGQSHDMVKCLLDHDAELEPKDRYEETPLIKAVKAGNENAVQMLYDAKPSTIETRSNDEWSALHHAVQTPHVSMTSFLLDIHPDLRHAVDRAGKTALHHCAEAGKLEQARVLLNHKHKLDVEAVDSPRRTPLYLAATKPATPERIKMVDLLIKHGALLNPDRLPPRMRDYPSLVRQRPPRRDSGVSRTSVSTSGSVGTATTGFSRLSRALGGKMGLR